jgi:N-acetyl-alpha-D-glucosaminyl L-malate synthase BshA
MKIAILVSMFPPKWLAGTEIATYNIAKYLAKKGHEVHVITSLDEGLSNDLSHMDQRFYVHRIVWQKVSFFGIMLFWIKIFFKLRKINPDIIHVQSILIGIPAVISKKILKIPYIVWLRGSDIYIPWTFKKSISKFVLKNANALIALTNDMKIEIEKTCSRKISVIPNGINLGDFETLSREKSRSRLQIKDEEKVILYVGTLRPIKGVKYLIKSMKIITKYNARILLLLVGDGVEKKKLENLVKELNLIKNIKFIGTILHERIPEYMQASDVFILPSLSEGFPLVSLEAMASGLPIVATNVRGLPEIINNGENGFLVEPKNPEQIAEMVLLLLTDDELRNKISRNNKEKAKDYNWVSIVERLDELYQNYM